MKDEIKGNEERKKRIQEAEKAIIGDTYKSLISLVKEFAKNDLPVLFIGETGTGKELFAKLYTAADTKRNLEGSKPYNCAGVPETLLRSHIFGHVKGAYTGAIKDTKGLLEICDGGILFLDELGDAPADFQAAILRVTEGYPFQKVGDPGKDIQVDVRIIAATNKPTKVREDLKHRFQVLPIPPLQKSDIPAMVKQFSGGTLKREYLEGLMSRDYPGNVRELIRECEKLRALKRKVIFSKRENTETFLLRDSFDYYRFEREYTLWNEFVQPLIDKHQLHHFKYKYFPLPEKKFANLLALYAKALWDLINGREEWSTSVFNAQMMELFKGKNINILFAKFDSKTGSKFDRVERPDLNPLIDLENYHDAMEGFESRYLGYHLKKHSNMEETANALHISLSTLMRKVRKFRQDQE